MASPTGVQATHCVTTHKDRERGECQEYIGSGGGELSVERMSIDLERLFSGPHEQLLL